MRTDNDVQYAAGAIEGFLEGEITNVGFAALSKVFGVIEEEVFWAASAGEEILEV